ncbi:isochorismate synthase [Exiguobacterium sp. TDN 0502]|uniref:isochorismate synthase n=1 Tax=Exiguobacterium sp. TDN 0502 TaxID=3420731 RepID=UPI003D784837
MAYAQQELKQCIEQAVTQANALQRPIIASYSWEIEATDMRSLEQGIEERFYFATPDRSMRAIGFGIVHQLQASGKDRFLRLQSLWTNVNRDHVGHDLFAFSGFSFTELKQPDYRWSSFGDASMTIPKFLFLDQDGQTRVTIFARVEPTDQVESILNQLALDFSNVNQPERSTSLQLTRLRLARSGSEAFEASFHQAMQYLETSLEKIVLAREVVYELDRPLDAAAVVAELEETQPGSYVFCFQPNAEEAFIGATPERIVFKQGNRLDTAAVAGSAPRHQVEEMDEALGQSLLQDQKNRMEHAIVADSIERTLRSFSERLDCPDAPILLKNRHIQHLYTPITAQLKTDVTLLQLIEKLHPTPALGGEPKQQAVEAIQKIETFERGWYGSPVGWMNGQDDGEFIVAIRSGLFTERAVILYAGCGLVEGSHLDSELAETETKLSPMLQALAHVGSIEKDDIYVD